MERHVVAGVRRERERRKDGDCIEDGRIIKKLFLNKEDESLCAGFTWLRTGKISGLLG
jgi:hypothetical protein